MSSFTTPLRVELQDDGIHWRVLEEFDYEMGKLGSGNLIHVPAGFETDFGSIPRIFWNIINPIGKAGKAYVLHDRLYSVQDYTRLESDNILLEAMEALKVNFFQRHIVYRAVRMFGWLAWDGHTKENKKKPVN